jgi:hypothetical protein
MGRHRQQRVQRHLAGLELLEQQIEIHDLSHRRRVTRLVGIDLVDGLAGVVIDHDGREGRVVIGAMQDAVPAALVGFLGAFRLLALMGRLGVRDRLRRADPPQCGGR